MTSVTLIVADNADSRCCRDFVTDGTRSVSAALDGRAENNPWVG